MKTILEVVNVEKYYGTKGSLTKALDDISFHVEEGEFVGIMGAFHHRPGDRGKDFSK